MLILYGVKHVVEKKNYVLKFNDFINEKYDMNNTVQGYIDEIVAGLTDEAMDALCDYGDEDLMQDDQLKKLFSKKFQHREDCPHGFDLYLVYDENNKEMELFSTYEKSIKWSVKCDINNVHSIISCAIECINHCIREE